MSDFGIDARQLTQHALNGKEIVVLDGYHFDLDYYPKAIKANGNPLVFIDDLAEQHFVADVVDEVTKAYKNEGKHFDYGCCILPTSPLIKVDNLKKALELLQNEAYDSVRPIVPFSYPIQRALKLKNGYVEMFNPEYKRKRSQDLETAFHDAGQFYWFEFEKGMHSERKGAIILTNKEVQDIDDEEEWKLAELKYSLIDEK